MSVVWSFARLACWTCTRCLKEPQSPSAGMWRGFRAAEALRLLALHRGAVTNVEGGRGLVCRPSWLTNWGSRNESDLPTIALADMRTYDMVCRMIRPSSDGEIVAPIHADRRTCSPAAVHRPSFWANRQPWATDFHSRVLPLAYTPAGPLDFPCSSAYCGWCRRRCGDRRTRRTHARKESPPPR